MSTTIDQKVVEMRFDNKHFEANVQESLSTLDKLKEKLHLRGATKGLESVNTAARNVNMAGLGNAVETVRARFSALEVMGVTALANITNQAVNTGKRMLSALTIDPIKTGLQEYETQINAVQTILANTSSKGTTIDDVNKALDELNTYADKTIYNFTEMTRNIGTFTAAGVDLDTSVSAIQGIANLAAVSGSTSQQASTAMYQLSQALAAGRVSLMDWNSVVNAGMGGEVFQNALKRTSEVMGTGAEAAIKKYGSFRESLTQGEWLTVDVLTETLNQFTMAAEEGSEEWEKYKASLKEKGYTEAQAVEILKMANTATDAATKVKTFTQLWDVLKESAQSGWSKTWKLIIGDFEQAKALLTPLADFLTNAINKFSDARNNLLEGALGKGFSGLIDKLGGVAKPIDKAIESVENLGEIVDKVILGDFGNGEDRFNKLTEAGYNYYRVQNKVNETLGDSFRYSEKQIEAQDKLLGKTQKSTEVELESTEATAARVAALTKLSDAELKALGYEEEQIEALREIEDLSKKLGIPLQELITNLDQIDGRWILWNGLKNIGQSIVSVFTSIGKAYREIFPPMKSDTLFNAIAGFHKFTTALVPTEETLDKLARTFKGLFAAIDLVLTLVGGPAKIIFKGLLAILDGLGINILDVTAWIGDAIVKARDWVDGNIENLVKPISNFVSKLVSASSGIKKWIAGIKDAENIPKYLLDGLIKGLKGGAEKAIQAVIDLGKRILEGIKNILGIHSPSTEFMQIASDCIAGFVNGFKKGASLIWSTVTSVAKKLLEAAKGMDMSQLLAVGFGVAGFAVVFKLLNILKNVTEPLASVGDLLESLSDTIGEFGDGIKRVSKAMKTHLNSMALLNMAISIGILVIALKSLTEIKAESLWPAMGALAVLAGIVVAMFAAVTLLSKVQGDFKSHIGSILAISTALVIMAFAIRMLASIKVENTDQLIISLISMVGSLIVLAAAMRLLGGADGSAMAKVSGTLIAISVALVIMVKVIKLIDQLDPAALSKGYRFMAAFGLFTGALILVSRFTGQYASRAGTMLLKISVALLIMVGVVKIAANMKYSEINAGIKTIEHVGGLFVALALTAGIANRYASRAGTMLLKASIAFLIIAGVLRLISTMDDGSISRSLDVMSQISLMFAALLAGTMAIGEVSVRAAKHASKAGSLLLKASLAFLVMGAALKLLGNLDKEVVDNGLEVISRIGELFIKLVAVSMFAGANASRAGTMLLMMSGAMVVLAGVLFILGELDPKKAYTALGIVEALGLMFMGLIAVTHFAGDAEKLNKVLITLIVAVGLLALAVAGLSFIDPKRLVVVAGSLSMVMGVFGMLVALTKFAKTTKTTNKTLFTLMAVAISLGGLIAILSFMNPERAMAGAKALSILLTTFTASILILSKSSGVLKTVRGTLLPMLGITAGLAAIVAGLSFINAGNAMSNAVALSLLLTTFSASMVILSHTGRISTTVQPMMLPMLLVTAALGGVLALMCSFPVQNAMTAAAALSTLLLSFSASMAILGLTGRISTTVKPMLVPMLLVLAGLAVILGVLSGFGVNLPVETARSLSILLLALSGAVAILGTVGKAAGAGAMGGVKALGILVGGMGLIIAALGAIMLIPGVNEFMNGGIELLCQIGTGLGKFVGSIVSGFADGVLNIIPTIGTKLSEFMTNVQGFIDGASKIPLDIILKVGSLAGAILLLSAANFVSGITQLNPLVGSLVGLGLQLSGFMLAADYFIKSAADIKPEMVEGVKALAETILILSAANVLEGLTRWFGGGSSLTEFGAQLPGLGSDLRAFADNLGDFGDDKIATVNCAAQAIKALADVAQELPNDGGWAGKIFGENSIGAFGAQLPKVGEGIANFVTSLGTFGDDQIKTVECAANAIGTLATAAKDLPNDGGWAGKIFGENSIGAFADQLPKVATALVSFVTNLGTFSEDQVTTVDCAASAIGSLAAAAQQLPNDGGWAGKIFGENSIATFGSNLPGLGTNLNSFVTNLGTFTDAQVSTVDCAGKAIAALAAAAQNLPNEGGWWAKIVGDNTLATFSGYLPDLGTNLSTFVGNLGTFTDAQVATVTAATDAITALAALGDVDLKKFNKNIEGVGSKLSDFGSSVSTFCSNMSKVGIDAINHAADGINKIADMLKNITGIDQTAGSKFKNALKDLSKTGVDSFVKSFTDATSKADVQNAAKKMVDNAIEGAQKKADDLKNGFKKLADKAAEGIDDKKDVLKKPLQSLVDNGISAVKSDSNYSDFKTAGAYLVDGFAAGISENDYKAAAKAAAMAKAAKLAAEEALGIESPSKEFYEVGDYAGQGLVLALADYGRIAYHAGEDIANSAKSGLNAAISRVIDTFNSDMDAQPTIRPVLDLSDVESGTGTLKGLLGGLGSTIGMSGRIGAVNAMMNRRNQNGVNDDVVSAIHKLDRHLDNIGNTTYSINGITYDDSSSVADAIEILTRAALMERRV